MHEHGVLDHAFLSVFLTVEGKPGRAEGPTNFLVSIIHFLLFINI